MWPVSAVITLVTTWTAARLIGTACTLPPLPDGQHSVTPREARGPPLQPAAAGALETFRSNARLAPFRHISLCSLPHPSFELLKETASWHGDTVIPLGMGDPRFQRWGVGFGVKLEHVQEYVRTVTPDTIVMFTDAFDVLLMESHAGVREAYFRAIEVAMAREPQDPALPTGATPRVPSIIFSTEFYCWPDGARAPEYPSIDRQFEFAFLNSGEGATSCKGRYEVRSMPHADVRILPLILHIVGTYIGPAGDLARAMESTNYTIAEDDQRFWTTVYLKSRTDGSLPRISLDHESDIFLCMSGRSVWTDVSFDPSARSYKYRGTPGQPAIIHFNSAKSDIPLFFRVLKGQWCPTDRLTSCSAVALGAPGAALAFVGLVFGRFSTALVAKVRTLVTSGATFRDSLA